MGIKILSYLPVLYNSLLPVFELLLPQGTDTVLGLQKSGTRKVSDIAARFREKGRMPFNKWRQEERGDKEKMAGWHCRLNGYKLSKL